MNRDGRYKGLIKISPPTTNLILDRQAGITLIETLLAQQGLDGANKTNKRQRTNINVEEKRVNRMQLTQRDEEDDGNDDNDYNEINYETNTDKDCDRYKNLVWMEIDCNRVFEIHRDYIYATNLKTDEKFLTVANPARITNFLISLLAANSDCDYFLCYENRYNKCYSKIFAVVIYYI